jgi:general nucleoside transport system permease protein
MLKSLKTLSLSLFVSVCLVALFLWCTGFDPLRVLVVMLDSTWGNRSGFSMLLSKTSLLILTGLAVAIPYRAGLFNIGGEGQMLLGGLSAALVGIYLPIGFLGIHWMLCLVCGMGAGALWAGLVSVLKTRRHVHEVISTIMLNFIALHIVNECSLNYFNGGPGTSRTAFIASSAHLPHLFQLGRYPVTVGIVIAVIAAVGLSVFLYKTWMGYHVRSIGCNAKACEYAGVSTGRSHGIAMLIGGACAGLAGAVQVCGMDYTFYTRFSGGYGFDGIAVAFLALNEPWAAIPASLVIATLRASDRILQLDMGIPKEMIFMIEGIVIISIAIFTRRRAHD